MNVEPQLTRVYSHSETVDLRWDIKCVRYKKKGEETFSSPFRFVAIGVLRHVQIIDTEVVEINRFPRPGVNRASRVAEAGGS